MNEAWVPFLFQTVLKDATPNIQAALLCLYQVFLTPNVVEHFNTVYPLNLFPQKDYSPLMDKFVGEKIYTDLDSAAKTLFFDRFASAMNLPEDSLKTLRDIALGSPWGNESFFPVPDWIRQEGLAREFLEAIAIAKLTPAVLREIAACWGNLEGYRILFRSQAASKNWSKKDKAIFLVTLIGKDQERLSEILKASWELKDIPGPSRVSMVSHVVSPMFSVVSPEILRAREILAHMGELRHDTTGPLGVMGLQSEMICQWLEEIAGTMPSELRQPLQVNLSDFREIVKALSGRLGKKFPTHVPDEDAAKKIIQEVLSSVQDMQPQLQRISALQEQIMALLRSPDVMPYIDVETADIVKTLERLPVKMQMIEDAMKRFFEKTGLVKGITAKQEWTDVRAMVSKESIESRMAPELLQGVDIIVEKGLDLPLLPMDEKILWEEILDQLNRNALQEMARNPPGKPKSLLVRLRREPAGNRLRIEVEDTGGGIPRNRIPHIFIRGATFEKEEGTGIGLDVVKKSVAASGGTIRVETLEGVGTRFILSLPTKDSFPAKDAIREQPQLPLVPTLTALSVAGFVGDGDSSVVSNWSDSVAQHQFVNALSRVNVDGSLLSTSIGEVATPLPQPQKVGKGGIAVQVVTDPLLNTKGMVRKADQGTLSVGLFAEPGGLRGLPPDLYMDKWVVGPDAANAMIDVNKDVAANLEAIAKTLTQARGPVEVGHLKGAILFKERHKSTIRDMIRLGIRVLHDSGHLVDADNDADFEMFWREMQGKIERGEDVIQCGNMYFLARKDVDAVAGLYTGKVDFITGADSTTETQTAAVWTKIHGGALYAQLVSKEKLFDDVPDADLRNPASRALSTTEIGKSEPYGFVRAKYLRMDNFLYDQMLGVDQMVPGQDLLLVAAAIKDSYWVDDLRGLSINPATGEKRVRFLIAKKGGGTQVLEAVFPGDYLAQEQAIEGAGSPMEKALLHKQYAIALAKDGWFERAMHQLEEARKIHPSGSYDTELYSIYGLWHLIKQRDADADATLMFSFMEEGTQDPLSVKPLLRRLEDFTPPYWRVSRHPYLFKYYPRSGHLELTLTDDQGNYFDIPLVAGFVDRQGHVINLENYDHHQKSTRHEGEDFVLRLTYRLKDPKPDLPDLTVEFRFPEHGSVRPYFTVRLLARNRTGKRFVIKEWFQLASENLFLGDHPEQIRFEPYANAGVWVDPGTDLGLYLVPGGKGYVLDHPGVPRVLGVSQKPKTQRGGIPQGKRIASVPLRVMVEQNPLHRVVGYPAWRLGTRLTDRKTDQILQEISSNAGLNNEQRQALISAAMLSSPPADWSRFQGALPTDAPGETAQVLQQLSAVQMLGPRAGKPIRPNLFVQNIVLDQRCGKLVALFHFGDKPEEFRLRFEEAGLSSDKGYAVFDVWENKWLGTPQTGWRVRDHYYFHPHERPPGGVKLLLILDPGEMVGKLPHPLDGIPSATEGAL